MHRKTSEIAAASASLTAGIVHVAMHNKRLRAIEKRRACSAAELQISSHAAGGRKIDEGTKRAPRSDSGISIAPEGEVESASDSRIVA